MKIRMRTQKIKQFVYMEAKVILAGKEANVENLWRIFFSDPSQWWDNRSEKVNDRYPDFRHKKSEESLWLNGKLNPPWVEEELAAMAPGSVQTHVFSWNRKLSRHVRAGHYEKALELFHLMQHQGIDADNFTFVPILKACIRLADFEMGRYVHKKITQCGYESDIYVGSCLVDMYAKWGSMHDAWAVFNKMPKRDVVTWSAMITGCVKCGKGKEALKLFRQMQQEGVHPDSIIFLGLLNACASVASLEDGRFVHEHIIQTGCESDMFVGSALVDMYAKCGSIEDAWRVFKMMPTLDVVAWNAMILGYSNCGNGIKALKLFEQMKQEGFQPNSVTFVGLLKACGVLAAIDHGRSVHKQIIQAGLETDIFVGSSLVDMYTKCGSIEDARRVFNEIPNRDVAAWGTMIMGLVKCGQGEEAMQLYRQMRQGRMKSDSAIFVGLLNAAASIASLVEGKYIHDEIIQTGCESDIFVGSALVDMYAKCGSVDDAWMVFSKMHTRDVVAWNAMILGYGNCGRGLEALQQFQQMQQEGVEPNSVTFVGLLRACSSLSALDEGIRVHERIMQSGCESDIFVSSSLVDMYAKCWSISDAWRVFSKMRKRDVVAWSAMILGYVNCGQCLQALELFQQMQQEGVLPNSVILVGLLKACGNLGELNEGKFIHEKILQSGLESDILVGSSLVDMYATCGSVEDACRVFNRMSTRNVIAWNAMILGYVSCGQASQSLELYQKMQLEEIEPNSITFAGLLKACASLGALDQGRCIHDQIVHTGCESDNSVCISLMDMYAKCGRVEDAWRVFNKMPECDLVAWNVMIGGYAMHGYAKEALVLFQRMCLESEEIDGVTFINLLSACSHGGLVEEGVHYFESMSSVYGVFPTLEHRTCMVDLLGRAGRLFEAEEMVDLMSLDRDAKVWIALLGACRIHGNIELAEHAAKQVQETDPNSAAGYVLLSNIYAAAGHCDQFSSSVWKQASRNSQIHLD